MTYSPHLVSSQVLQQMCRLWACARGCGPLSRLVSARNVLLLCQGGASQARLTWAHLSSVLVELLKVGLVTPAELETQFIALFRLTWPPVRVVFPLLQLLKSTREDTCCIIQKISITVNSQLSKAQELRITDSVDNLCNVQKWINPHTQIRLNKFIYTKPLH